MIKNITGKEFYELMCNIGYKEHVFFMNPEDYEEGMTKTDTINGWLGFAINTWLDVCLDLMKSGTLEEMAITKTNINDFIVPLTKLKVEALWKINDKNC